MKKEYYIVKWCNRHIGLGCDGYPIDFGSLLNAHVCQTPGEAKQLMDMHIVNNRNVKKKHKIIKLKMEYEDE